MRRRLPLAAGLLTVAGLLLGCPNLSSLSGGDAGVDAGANDATTEAGPGDSSHGDTSIGDGAAGDGTSDGPADGATPSAYAEQVLVDMPIAYYRLDDPPGSTQAIDSSGHGLHGVYGASVLRGVPGLLASDADTAVSIPGGDAGSVEDIVIAAKNPAFETPTITVECWVRLVTVDTERFFVSYGGDDRTAPYENYILQLGTGASPNFYVPLQSPGTSGTSVPPIAANQTLHLVASWDGQSNVVYVNGTPTVTGMGSGPIVAYDAGPDGLGIGSVFSGTRVPMGGVIDEVAVYGYALSLARVIAHYDTGTTAAGDP